MQRLETDSLVLSELKNMSQLESKQRLFTNKLDKFCFTWNYPRWEEGRTFQSFVCGGVRLAHTEPVTLWLSAALSGFLLCDLKSTQSAHSVALSHWAHNTLRGILPPAMSHWFVMHLFLCASPVYIELLWVLMRTSVNP